MYERFSRPAVEVVEAAAQEARAASRRTAGTESLLLALAETENSTARTVLVSLGLDGGAIRGLSVSISDPADIEAGTFGPDARKALEFAIFESARRAHGYIGTGHILLGVLSLTQAAGARTVVAAGIDIHSLETRLEQALSDDREADDPAPSKRSAVSHEVSAPGEQMAVARPDETYALKQENERLRSLLRRNGIDPNSA